MREYVVLRVLERERDTQLLSTLLIAKAAIVNRSDAAEMEAYNKLLHRYYAAFSGKEVEKDETSTMENDLNLLKKLIGKAEDQSDSKAPTAGMKFTTGGIYKGEVSNMSGREFLKGLN